MYSWEVTLSCVLKDAFRMREKLGFRIPDIALVPDLRSYVNSRQYLV